MAGAGTEKSSGSERADLLELVLLGRLVFARFGGLSGQLFCCELEFWKAL